MPVLPKVSLYEDSAILIEGEGARLYGNILRNGTWIEDRDNVGLFEWSADNVARLRSLGVDFPTPFLSEYNIRSVYSPFYHQLDTADFLVGTRRGFVFSSPGVGKTASAIWAADYLMEQGDVEATLVVCPLSIMRASWIGDLFACAPHCYAVVAHGSKKRRNAAIQSTARFVVTNYDSFERMDPKLLKRFGLVIIDECFVAGTGVDTPTGKRAIETLAPGEEVLTSNGPMRIRTVTRNLTTRLVRVRTTDGNELTCTPDHPFFTDAGWVTASHLVGRRLVVDYDLRSMRNAIQDTPQCISLASEAGYAERDDLLAILRTEEVPRHEPGSELLQSNAAGRARQSDGYSTQRSVQESYVGEPQEGWICPTNSWRERYRPDDCRTARERCVAGLLGMELPSSVGVEATRLSYELQTRLRQRSEEGWAGSRRKQSRDERQESPGCEERIQTSGVWVESVSYIEQDNPVYVYNISVDGTPNYFVGGGLLVHNCNAYRSTQTARFKHMNKFVKENPDVRLWLMTGTPAAQSPEDAYGLAKLVCPDRVPQFFGRWRDMVMTKVSMHRYIAKPDATEKVFEVLQPAIRYRKEDCLDLPPMTYQTREVPLSKQQRVYYERIRKEMLAETSHGTISAVNAGVVVNKLLQISAGAVYSDDGVVLTFDVSDRTKELLEIIHNASGKVIVFAAYRHNIEAISAMLTEQKITHEKVDGSVPEGARTKIFSNFQTTEDPRVLVMQPQAVAHGLTLTAANTIVWWGPTSSLETYDQANARIDRQSQRLPTQVIHFVSSPAEAKSYARLKSRKEVQASLLSMYDEVLKTPLDTFDLE